MLDLKADPQAQHLPLQKIRKDLDRLRENFVPPKGRLWIATQGAQTVGCVSLRTFRNRTCEMKRLYVREAFRGFDIGTLLVEGCVDYAKANNFVLVRLATTPSMKPAISLYNSQGFREGPPWRRRNIEGYVFMTLALKQRA
jgi:GNAT superfamily N-acetyltransferase